MSRVTEKHLQAIVERINRQTGNPLKAYETVNGKCVAQIGAYLIDNAYGGFSLSQIVNEAGGERDVLGCRKVPKAQLASLLFAFIKGMESKP